jgi:hypothetical protein
MSNETVGVTMQVGIGLMGWGARMSKSEVWSRNVETRKEKDS